MLEEAIQEVSQRYPVFPLALSVIDELQQAELEKKISKDRNKDELKDIKKEGKIKEEDAEKDEEIEKDENDETTVTSYTSHEEELILHNQYGNSKLDYNLLFNSRVNVKKLEFEEIDYTFSKLQNETKSETMSLEEASKMLQDIQYGALTGTNSGKNLSERRRFVNWTVFNQELLMLFHSLYSLTGEVDYSRTF